MGWKPLLIVGLLCAPGTGCQMYYYAARNLLEAPINQRDDCLEKQHYRQIAEKAWAELQKVQTPESQTVYYHDGFVDGFSDYLYAGGTGEPPLMPPWRYRGVSFETPEGHRAIEDWFGGFRQGTQAAHASGLRDLTVLPLPSAGAAGSANCAPPATPAWTEAPAEELLPMPRNATPAPAVGPVTAPEKP